MVGAVLAATKSQALGSWASLAIFGAVGILFGFAQPFLVPRTFESGRRRSPGPLKRLFPEGLMKETIRRNKRSSIWLGGALLVIGSVGFLVRLVLPS